MLAAAPRLPDLSLLAAAEDNRSTAAARYPGLASLPPAERGETLRRKVFADLAVALLPSLAAGAVLSLAAAAPSILVSVLWAGRVHRRHGPTFAGFFRYVEFAAPLQLGAFLAVDGLAWHPLVIGPPGGYALLCLAFAVMAGLACRAVWRGRPARERMAWAAAWIVAWAALAVYARAVYGGETLQLLRPWES